MTIARVSVNRRIQFGDHLRSCCPLHCGLSELRELHLRNNKIRTLPAAIGTLAELRLVDLRGNPIETIADSVLDIPKLEKLDLRWIDTLREPAWLDTLEDRGCLVYR